MPNPGGGFNSQMVGYDKVEAYEVYVNLQQAATAPEDPTFYAEQLRELTKLTGKLNPLIAPSLDRGVMEKIQRMGVIEGPIRWYPLSETACAMKLACLVESVRSALFYYMHLQYDNKFDKWWTPEIMKYDWDMYRIVFPPQFKEIWEPHLVARALTHGPIAPRSSVFINHEPFGIYTTYMPRA